MRKIFLILSMMFALHAVSVEAQTSSENTLVIDEVELFSDTTSLEEGLEDPMEDDDYYDGYINELLSISACGTNSVLFITAKQEMDCITFR